MPSAMKCLYVFMDESGDLVFKEKGTQHFILSAVMVTDPCVSAAALQDLKYELLANKSTDLEFHATYNSKGTRLRVIDTIKSLRDHISVHTIYFDKAYTHPKYHDEVGLFGIVATAMGRYIAKCFKDHDIDRIVLVFDSVLTGKKQEAFKAKVKPLLKATGADYHLVFHPVKSDLNGQIADYFSWAAFRYLEFNDPDPALSLLKVMKWEWFNMWKNVHTRYWNRDQPA